MTVSIRTTNRLTFCMPAGHGAVEFVELPSHLVDPAFLIAQKGPSLSQTDYQNVSAKLLQAHVPPSSRIFVSSPVQGDGKTCTAFNLACTMAKSGASVLLVELNFTEPRIRTALGNLKIRHGLESALQGRVRPADTIFCELSTGLHIAAVRSATRRDKLQAVLKHLVAFFDWGSEHYEILVIDCPPVISQDWKVWFSSFIGTCLLVVRERYTPRIQVERAMKLLGAHLQGVLLNAVHRDRDHPYSAAESALDSGALESSRREEGPAPALSAARGEAETKTISMA